MSRKIIKILQKINLTALVIILFIINKRSLLEIF